METTTADADVVDTTSGTSDTQNNSDIHPVKQLPYKSDLQRQNKKFIDPLSLQNFSADVDKFLQSLKGKPCRDHFHKRDTKCDCLMCLNDEDGRSIALIRTAIISFFQLPAPVGRLVLFKDVTAAINLCLMKKIKRRAKRDKSNIENISITGMKEQYFDECLSLPLPHGNNNNSNKSSSMAPVYASLHSFFQTIKSEGEPHASRQVRSFLGRQYLRDDEDNTLLAAHWTKRKVYERFVWECGWIAKSGGDGSYGCIKEFGKRQTDEYLWPEGSTRKDVCCFSTFLNFWNNEYKDVKISQQAKDTCSLCWEFGTKISNLNNLRRNQQEREEESTNNINNIQQTNLLMASMIGDVQAQEINFDEEQETLVEGMTGHVHEFKIQRGYFQQKDSEAKNDTINNTELENRTVVYCGDYSQNLDLPHFGGEQPGDTYYFSPLIVNVFGLADLCTKDDVLSTYIYTEAEGKKGGNNVCSLIYKKLNDDGFIEASEPAKQLCLFFDNCGGQNKNRMVLRLAQILVDTSVFSRVEVVFFIVGHTKNVCDRRFKDVKKTSIQGKFTIWMS